MINKQQCNSTFQFHCLTFFVFIFSPHLEEKFAQISYRQKYQEGLHKAGSTLKNTRATDVLQSEIFHSRFQKQAK